MNAEERREALAELLCRGTGERQCINYDRDVAGGCSWCDRDADALTPLVEEWIAKESKVAARVAQEGGYAEGYEAGAAGVVARVEAVLGPVDAAIALRSPARVLQFWVGRLRAALATEEPTP